MSKLTLDVLRRSFSYLEKALPAAGQPSLPLHAERAQRLLDTLHDQMKKEIGAAGKELQAALREQSALGERAAAGRISPAKANARNRELTAVIEGLRARITDLNGLLAARSSADLGGFIDLPIEDYETRVAPPQSADKPTRTGILSALIEDEPTIAGIQLKPTRVGVAVWAACLLVAITASSWYLGLVHWGGTLTLDIAAASPPSKLVTVTIHNNGNEAVEVYVPLPEGGVSSNEEGSGARVCGLRVWTRENGAKEFRMLPASMDCWVRPDRKFNERPPVEVPPRLPAQVMIDAGKLNEAQSLRIALVRADGSVLDRRDIDLR